MIQDNFQINKITRIFQSGTNHKKIIPDFIKNKVFQKWTMAILLSAVLSFLITPQIHYSDQEYKVDAIAVRDVRADRDLLVEDKAATEQKRNEALKDVKTVYDYDSNIPLQLKAKITKAFSTIESSDLFNDSGTMTFQSSLKKARNDFENLLGVTITDDEFNVLKKYAFSQYSYDKILNLVVNVYNSELITNASFTKQDMENGIVIRDIIIQSEKKENNLNSIKNINYIGALITKKAYAVFGNDSDELRRVSISLAKKLIQPNLTFNKNASERKKNLLQSDVKPVLFQILKDEMIIREGQKITSPDLDKLNALLKVKNEKSFSNISIFFGMFFLILCLLIVLFHLAKQWIHIVENITNILFLSVVSLFQVILIKIGIFMSEAINRAFPFIFTESCFYAIPFAVGAIIVGVLINRNVALIFSIFSAFLTAFIFLDTLSMMFFSFIGSAVASYKVVHCKQRSSFFKVGILLGILNVFTIIPLCLFSQSLTIFSVDIIIKIAMGFTGGLISGIIVAGITPLFESLFNYTTDIKLLELANLNQPIFQKMIMEAPGTYHHSIIVASLVEAAAEAIGANSLLAKVSAYYHDIGKIKKPLYFIENQRNGENKHVKLSPKMSSLIITTHVRDGCEIAEKAKLGIQITNIIREHHGTSLVSYFYDKAKKDKNPSIRSLPETDFRYIGPKPQSREAGLVLLGDIIEASSRTLTNPTPARIQNLVRDRIERVFMDGQLNECELTLHDLNKIADSFTRILNGIFHQRIDYPEPVIREFKGGRKENKVDTDRKQAENNTN